jgi:tRNA (adenine-N(1)-)-methyltransferase non-catalytic subunit
MSTGEVEATMVPAPVDPVPKVQIEMNDETSKNGESSTKPPQPPLHETLLQRVSTIKEGDNVLLRMPSDMVKAVVASKDG